VKAMIGPMLVSRNFAELKLPSPASNYSTASAQLIQPRQIAKTCLNRARDLKRGAHRMINAEGISPIDLKSEICTKAV
jgi:hypothetical protein